MALRKFLPAFVLSLAALLLPRGGAARAETAKPAAWKITEVGRTTVSGTWTWDTDNRRYVGRWSNGAVSHLTVRQGTDNRLVILRNDPRGPTPGLRARYQGTVNGGSMRGTVRWTFKGRTTTGTWQAVRLGQPAGTKAAPLNKARLPQERRRLLAPSMRKSFPILRKNFEVLGLSTPKYNCIAHSLGIHSRWVNPLTGPASAPLARMDAIYRARGYVRASTLDYRLEPGKQKVVVYATLRPDQRIKAVTHAARQAADGTWTSKLGKLALIRHLTPQALNGPTYGRPVAVYVRSQERVASR
jgi:hypothetical protein